MNNWILDDAGQPVVEPDLMTWARWFEDFDNRKVARTEIGDVHVSTVFLGVDHSWGGGPPLLFETMVFGLSGELECQWRYTTRAQAEAGHERVVAAIRAGKDPYRDD